ncbi:hypothetical protein DFH07DRAFT_957663 [Mycena maculata]|uniref:Uncharacterized protein n=1 Tax=Mycena maculata TaxID=230809 RepID=A0AAD7JA07_9AGAR|nr:hypothetical protein DFH07DRAFT_957663 [Mycena maculata]
MAAVPRPSRHHEPAAPVTDPDKENQGTVSTVKSGTKLDALAEVLEKKYNIEGCNTADIIYARQENDAAQAKIAAQEAELVELKRRIASMAGVSEPVHDNRPKTPAEGPIDDEEGPDAALARENAELKRQLAEMRAGAGAGGNGVPKGPAEGSIARPPGSAGTNFNIRDSMGLGRTVKDGEQYRAILRNMRDLTLQAGINWESPWAQIPSEQKAKLFAVERERHPILKRFHNDWATEEIVKQYIKNRRNNAYRHNWLEVPEKYKYLKSNAAQRDPSGPRGRQNKVAKVKVAAAKHSQQQKKPQASKQKSSATSGKVSSKKKAKGKGRAVVPSDDEDVEMPEVSAGEDDSD